ncbi:MAG: hypothetical protein AAGU06_02740 [Candidatus Shapirobacteria bacterium]
MNNDAEVVMNEDHEKLDGLRSFALIMVKPHAVKEASDVVVLDLFDGNCEKYASDMNLDKEILKCLHDTKVVTHFYRHLEDPKYRPVLEFLYHKENDKEYYPIVIEQYAGDCMFILLSSPMKDNDFYCQLQKLKGEEKLDDNGKVVQEGIGIRRVLILPRQAFDLDSLSESEMRIITNNVIHVPDSPQESARAIRMLLHPKEIDTLSENNDDFKKFINEYDPISIVRSR